MIVAKSIEQLNSKFLDECLSYETYVTNAQFLYSERIEKDGVIFDNKTLNLIVEYAFFRIFLLWEYYLEQTFIRYSLGGTGKNGKKLTTYVRPLDFSHAYNLVQGTSKYPDWTNSEIVLKLAENFFENGGPYVKLTEMRSTLQDIKVIRNSLAHISINAREKFESLVRKHNGHCPLGLQPAEFLLLTNKADPLAASFLKYYSKSLKFLSSEIANPD